MRTYCVHHVGHSETIWFMYMHLVDLLCNLQCLYAFPCQMIYFVVVVIRFAGRGETVPCVFVQTRLCCAPVYDIQGGSALLGAFCVTDLWRHLWRRNSRPYWPSQGKSNKRQLCFCCCCCLFVCLFVWMLSLLLLLILMKILVVLLVSVDHWRFT